jgi:DNA polymerase I
MNHTQGEQEHLVLIDGYGFVFRAYHSLPPLTRADGVPTGALYGFTSMLLKIIPEIHASHIAIVFDSGVSGFRNELYPQYKANRPEVPADLLPQFPLVREAAEALNLTAIEKTGIEADDLIASYTKLAVENNMQVTIISSDKDLMQLICEEVTMYDPLKSKTIEAQQVLEKFGVMPNKLLDVLSLMGDSSDNIPGAHGIGPKTAAELINRFGSLDLLKHHVDEIKQPKRKEAIKNDWDKIEISRKLITLKSDVEIDTPIDQLRIRPINKDTITLFLEQQGFKTLINRATTLFDSNSNTRITPTSVFQIIEVKDGIQIDLCINDIIEEGEVAISLDTADDNVNILSLATARNKIYTINYQEQEQEINLLNYNHDKINFSKKDVTIILDKILNNNAVRLIGHDLKNIFHKLNCNINNSQTDDIMMMSYILDNGRNSHDLESLIALHIKNRSENKIYTCNYILNIYYVLSSRLINEKLFSIYQRVERNLSEVIYYIEKAGVKIDKAKLKSLSVDFNDKMKIIEKNIYKLANQEFNIASPKQLGDVLFGSMGIQSTAKTSKTKSKSTNVEVLEELASSGHTIAEEILKWRHLSKLKGTYIDSLILLADSNDRVHTNFQMALTSTGRLSSKEPNLQNIPIRTEEGTRIRSCFISSYENYLISADYSQIELRILAHIANVESLKKAFKEKRDIHSITASEVFGIKLAEITPEIRRKAKAINFGIIYGISAFGLANQLKISRSEAKQYIDTYFHRYPEIKTYVDNTINFARTNGYVNTLLGRKIFVPNINSNNAILRGFAERAAINAPLQGTNSDIIKKAMIKIHQIFLSNKLSANIILQIHDELLIEVSKKDCTLVTDVVKDCMEEIVILDLPLLVEIRMGKNWAEVH